MKHLNQTGDTIVEVLIALAVLAFALGSGFAIVGQSNKSLQANTEQFQAQQIAAQQVEYLRTTNGGLDTVTGLRPVFNGSQCFVKSGTDIQLVSGSQCQNLAMGGAPIYNVNITCFGSSGGSKGYGTGNCSTNKNVLTIYAIKVTWDNVKGGTSNVELQYGM